MDNYPPGMTMKEFDRAHHDETEECEHGRWTMECSWCETDAEEAWAERRMSELEEPED